MNSTIADESEFALDVLGTRITAERERRGLSVEELAHRCGVSRSMLYEVERGRKAPTVLVLVRTATGLGASVARLVGEERDDQVVLLRRDEQVVVRDASGWERRILSPALPGMEFEFMRTTIGPHVDAGVFDPHAPGSREYVAVESGELALTIDQANHRLGSGDAIYYRGDCRHAFRNPLARAIVKTCGSVIFFLRRSVVGVLESGCAAEGYDHSSNGSSMSWPSRNAPSSAGSLPG
jgi:transcriptional regulator with XRE-family HTH domain